jgi:hypothetical protein
MSKTKQKFILLLTFSVIVATILSCSKDRVEEDEIEYASLDDFYDINELEEQEFIIDSVPGDTIVGKEGTKIWGIPKEIFMKKATEEDIT